MVEGKTTVFDECMVLMTNRPGSGLWSEKASRVQGKMKIKRTCKNIVCIMSM